MIPVLNRPTRNAQRAVAVGGGGFVPTDLGSQLKLWVKADTGLYDATSGGSLVTTDGAAVARWEDQSGNGNHLTQATGTKQPLLKTSLLNGLPIIRFDGSNDSMAKAFTLSQPVTVIFAAKLRSLNNNFDTYVDGTFNNLRICQNGGTSAILMYAGAFGPSVSCTLTNWNIASFVFNGASSFGRVNAGTDATGNPGAPAASGITVGARGDTAAEFGLLDIAELCVTNTALSSGDRLSVESYMDARYAIY